MNGAGEGLDKRIAAQAERLARRETSSPLLPEVTAAAPVMPANDAPPAVEPQVIAVLSATLLSNGTAQINMPENRDHFLQLINVLIGQGLERAAAAGRQIGAEEAVKAVAANPKLGPLLWFKQKFGRAVKVQS